MADIQRYTVDPENLYEHVPASEYPMLREVVLYADHVEAMNAQYERGFDNGVRQGQRDERKDIIGMLRYNTVISIWLTAGDETQRKEAEFVLRCIANPTPE